MPVDERALSDAQLLEMMGLLKGSDTVELKVTIQARERDDTVIKLRPVVPEDVPEEMRQSPALSVEVDATPEGFVCSVDEGVAGKYRDRIGVLLLGARLTGVTAR